MIVDLVFGVKTDFNAHRKQNTANVLRRSMSLRLSTILLFFYFPAPILVGRCFSQVEPKALKEEKDTFVPATPGVSRLVVGSVLGDSNGAGPTSLISSCPGSYPANHQQPSHPLLITTTHLFPLLILSYALRSFRLRRVCDFHARGPQSLE